MKTMAKKIGEKVTDVHVLVIDEKKLCDTVRKRKNWSAPGIDGIQNFWWKKLKGACNSMIRCFNQWIEHPEEIPTWITQERTVLLPMSEDLSNERSYQPITCLSTCYKIFTGMAGNYMKEHAEINNILDRSQLGTCSGIIDNAIMNEVRGQQQNLAVAFYDYQKAYDMVRNDWMIRVYRWMKIPENVINIITKLMEGRKTKLEVTENGKTVTSRTINVKKGFLQGDSYLPVGFCLTEVSVAMLIGGTDGYSMGERGGEFERLKKNTQSFCRQFEDLPREPPKTRDCK